MVAGPKGRAAWRVLDAQYFGLAQRRKRVIVVADFGNGADPAAVLFEPESVRRDSPPSRETGKDVAPTISARPSGGGGLGTDFDLDGGLIQTHAIQAGALRENPNSGPDGVGVQADIAYTLEARAEVQAVSYAPEIARCVATREGSSQDYESTTMVAVGVTGDISHTLKAEGADASEDETGRGTPIIAQSVALRGREGGGTAELDDDLANALRASGGGGGDKAHVLAACGEVWPALQSHAGSGYCTGQEQNAGAYLYGSAVRRLTPRECERLMGFPDDYTRIPWRGKPAERCPDGPRYRALGNSWAVPLFAWLGKRIEMYMPATPAAANDNTKQDIADAAA